MLRGQLPGARRLNVVALFGIAALALACAAVVVTGVAPLRGNQSTGDSSATPVAPTPRDEVVTFSLGLALPGAAELDRYLGEIHDRSSPLFRQYLDPAEFGARFGLPDPEVDRVERYLAERGVEIVGSYPQRTALEVRGSAATVDELFGTQLFDYRDAATGARFHRPRRAARVPEALQSAVTAVGSLDSRPARALQTTSGATSSIGMTPAELARAYEITPLHDAGITGNGQFVAVVSFADVKEADIAEWRRQMGISAKPAEQIVVAGRPAKLDGGTVEVLLDIEAIHAVAPGAQVLNFKAMNGTGYATMVNTIVADRRARVISISWGRCDSPERDAANRQLDQVAFDAASIAGVNVVIASGDSGAYTCRHSKLEDLRVVGDWPSGSPYVLSVGGTYLQRRTDGTWFDERAWEEPFSALATGGGLNRLDARPPWQRGPGVVNASSNGKRQSPDVAAIADCESGLYSYGTSFDKDSKQIGEPQAFSGCGTSVAAPVWAALIALFQQYASQQGAGQLGFINPMLYDIAARAPANTVFHDVVLGGNLLHNASPGWDYATGLGSPIAAPLAQAIVGYLKGQR